jgi:hypothetical protein
MSERIHCLKPEEEEQHDEEPAKRYKSKFPGNLPPSWSTFNTQNTAHPGVHFLLLMIDKQY